LNLLRICRGDRIKMRGIVQARKSTKGGEEKLGHDLSDTGIGGMWDEW